MFKNIIGFDYAINEAGEVRNNKTGRILKQVVNGRGYWIVNLSVNGKSKNHSTHRLLGIYFLGCPSDKQIDHIDGNPLNNDLSNLRIVTIQENSFNRTRAKGYYLNKRDNNWRAQIGLNGKQKYLGLYDTEEEASAAYLAAKSILHVMP